MRFPRRVWALSVLCLLTVSCSVATPRHQTARPAVESDQRGPSASTDLDGEAPGAAPTPDEGTRAGPDEQALQPGASQPPPSSTPGSTEPGSREPTSGGAPPHGGGDPDASGPRPAETATSEPLRASEVGVTDTTITFSVSGTFSGPHGPLIDEIVSSGMGVWTDDVNDRGGIHGRQIRWVKVDDKGSSDGSVAACKEIQGNGTMFVLSIGNTEAPQSQCLDQAQIPMAILFQSALDPGWSWIKGMTYGPTTGRALPSFLRWHLGAEAGELKAGVMYVNTPLFSSGADGFREAAAGEGIEVVAEQPIDEGQTSFVAELARIRDAGANVVVLYVFTEVIGILRDARAMGYAPHFTGTGFHIDEFTQGAQGLMSGMTSLRPFATVSTPRYAEFRQKASRYGYHNQTTSVMATYGAGLMLERLLTEAGRNPTRESLQAAFSTVGTYDDQIWPPLAWPEGRVLGSDAWFPAVCCNADGTWKTLGPPAARF